MSEVSVLYRHGSLNRECVGRDCHGPAEYVATIVIQDEVEHRRVVTLCLCEECASNFMVNHPEDLG